jgi:hypothetical protein
MFYFLFYIFLWFLATLFILIFSSKYGVLWYSMLVQCLFNSNWKIGFDPVQIESNILALSKLQIRKHEYFRHSNIIIFLYTYVPCHLFYVINMNTIIWFIDYPFNFFNDFKFILHRYTLSIWLNVYYVFNKK